MDQSPIPLNVCKLHETNETRIEETYKVLHQKLLQVQQDSTTLRLKLKKLEHETALLEKEKYCLDSKNKILEDEILILQAKTEEVTGTIEELKWTMFKINLIKEFENKQNESVNKLLIENKGTSDPSPIECIETRQYLNTETKTKDGEIIGKIAYLKEEIETQKSTIHMTDPKLLISIKMLEKRNAALLIRYQRQLSEATARYRQTQTEVSSLRRMLADTLEKNKE